MMILILLFLLHLLLAFRKKSCPFLSFFPFHSVSLSLESL